jgi:hypothetical protein
MDGIIITQEMLEELNLYSNISHSDDIFDSSIINNYYGWIITDNGKHLYNNGIEGQPTLIYNTETNNLFELEYNINSGYQYVLFTSNYIIYNSQDNIIIQDYKHKIIRIINNYNNNIINLINNDKFLVASDDNNEIKIYNLDTFDILFTTYFYHLGCMNVSNNNKYLISVLSNINIYNLEDNTFLYYNNPYKSVKEIAINKHEIAALIANNSIVIHNLNNRMELDKIYEYDKYENFHYLNYSYDGMYLYYGNSYKLVIFNALNYNIIKKYTFEKITSYCLTNDDYKILYINETELGTIYTPQFHNIIHDLLIDYLPEEIIMNVLFYL